MRPTARALGIAFAITLASISRRADAENTPPRLISSPEVTAPTDAPPNASVLLQLTIDSEGRVTDAIIVDGVRGDIDATALDAARTMQFTPAARDGHPIGSRLRFRFRLHAAPSSEPPPSSSSPSPWPSPPPSPSSAPPDSASAAPASPAPAGEARSHATPESTQGVTVRGHREPGAATRMTYRAEELTTVPGTFGEPLRIVATQPGVARSPFGLGFFVVRGASFEDTGFFVDGFPVLILYHLAAGPAVISSRLIGQLDFYPGGYPLQYGRFSAGVIALETHAPPTDRPRIEAEVDFLRASLLGVLPFDHGRGSIAIAIRRSYYDFLLPLIAPGVQLNYTDGQLRADYRFSERLRASLFVFGSADFFDRTQSEGAGATVASTNDGIVYNFARGIAKLEYLGPHGIFAQLSAMVGYDETRLITSDPGRPDRGLRAYGNVVGERASVRVPTGRYLTTTIGLDALAYLYTVNLSWPSAAGFGYVPPPQSNPRVANIFANIDQTGIAAYIEEVLHVGRVEFTSGTRLESVRYSHVSQVLADPRAVLRVRLHERVTAIASTGLFHQAPPFFALVPQAGNPNLLPQQSWQSSVGVEATLPLAIEARITGFYNRMSQLPRASYQIVMTPDGAARALALSDGQGQAYGLEVMIRRRLTNGVYGWLSYTLSRSERWIEDPVSHQIVGRVVPFTYDQTHILNLAASWDITRHWRVGTRFQLSTGYPISHISGGIYDSDADGYRPQYTSESERLPTFHQLDLRVDYSFRAGPLAMTAYLDILNVYNAPNAESWTYRYDYADRAPRTGIPILPTLGIRGEL